MRIVAFILAVLVVAASVDAAVYKNKAGQKVPVFAVDATGAAKTGDAAQITAQISKDGGECAAITDTNPTELDATDAPGIYLFDLSQAESNCDLLIVCADSSTSGVVIRPVAIYTEPEIRTANATQVEGGDATDALTTAATAATPNLNAAYDAAKTAAQAGDKMDLVDAPNATAIAAFLTGLSGINVGDVGGKVLGGGSGTITGAGVWAYNDAGDGIFPEDAYTTLQRLAGMIALDGAGPLYQWTSPALELASSGGGSDPGLVWDELLADHDEVGSAGAALAAAGTAGDPWLGTPGDYEVGTFGYLLATMLDAPVTSRAGADSAEISITSTVAADGTITIMAGDDYPATNPIPLTRTWTDVNVSAFTPQLYVRLGARGTGSGTAIGTTTVTLADGVLTAEIILTSAETASLMGTTDTSGPLVYRYQLLLTAGDGSIKKTAFTGALQVHRSIAP